MNTARKIADTEQPGNIPDAEDRSFSASVAHFANFEVIIHRALRHPKNRMLYLADITHSHHATKPLINATSPKNTTIESSLWVSKDGMRPGHIPEVLLSQNDKKILEKMENDRYVTCKLYDISKDKKTYSHETSPIDTGIYNTILVHPAVKYPISTNKDIQFVAVSLASDKEQGHDEAIKKTLHRNLPVHIPEDKIDRAKDILENHGCMIQLDAFGDIEGTLFIIDRSMFFNVMIHEIIDDLAIETIDIQTFMKKFGKYAIEAVRSYLKPIFTESDPALSKRLNQVMKRTLIPSQEKGVQSIVKGFQHGQKAILLGAEMSTGKTITALGAIKAMNAMRSIITMPPQLTEKWTRETEITLPNTSVINLNNEFATGYILREARNGFSVENPTLYLVGRTRTRMEERIEPAYAKKINYAAMKELNITLEEIELNLMEAKLAGNDQERIDLLSKEYHKLKETKATGIFQPICPHCSANIKISKMVDEKKNGRIVRKRQIVEATIKDLDNNKDLHCTKCKSPMKTYRPIYDHYHDHAIMRKEMMVKWLSHIPGIGEQMANDILIFHSVDDFAKLIYNRQFEELTNIILSKNSKKKAEIIAYMEQAPFSLTHAAIPPFKAMKRIPKNIIDLLVSDEAHEDKGDDSLQGMAYGTMATVANHCLLLSGTIMGGLAKDLHPILYRSNPNAMKARGYGYGSIASYQANEGMLEETQKTNREGKLIKSVRPIAGYSASAIAHDLLPRSVFIQLSDIIKDISNIAAKHGLELNLMPSYREKTIRVKMSDEQKELYMGLVSASRKALMSDNRGAQSRIIHGMLAALDRPNEVTATYSTEVQPWVKEGKLAPKEVELIKLIKREKAEGRRVLIYVNYTQKLDCQQRIQAVLEQTGINTKILRSSGASTEDREAWIMKQIDEGMEAMISHPRLIMQGHDLPFPTIVNLQVNSSTFVIRQANRRSWRIGFTEPVRVYYLVYEKTVQEIRMSHMAAKIRTALDTEGDCSASALDSFLNEDDSSMSAIARSIINGESSEIEGAINGIEEDDCSQDFHADIDHLPSEAELIAMANAKNDTADMFSMFG